MKLAFLFVSFCCYHLTLFCQIVPSAEQQRFITQVNAAASQYPVINHQTNNIKGPQTIKMNIDSLSKPGVLKQLLQSQNVKKNNLKNIQNGYLARPSLNTCADTSYRRLMEIYNGWIYLMSVSQTMDGGMLVPVVLYDTTRLPNPWWRSFSLLIKLDGDGNVVWLKQFEETNSGGFSQFNMNKAFELPNHDIIYTGLLDTTSGLSNSSTIIYRLNSSGNIIWQNRLKSQIGIFNSAVGSFRYDIETAVEGINGDVILCGTSNSNLSSGHIETVTRLDSFGKEVWDINYGNHGIDGSYLFGAEGVAAFVKKGQISLVGLSHGTNYPQTAPAVNILTLDYNSGALLKKRFFRPDYQDPTESFLKSFVYYQNKCTQLSNGNFLFYGKLFSDFAHQTATKDHYGIIEFDPDFNLINSYTISSTLQTNFYNNQLLFDASGRGILTLLEYLDSYESNTYFAAFQNQQFQKQRKVHYTNAGSPGYNGFAFLNDNGYAYLQSYFEDQPVAKSYFEFRKMHNSDTSSQCLGKDTMLLQFLPLNIIEDSGYFYLHPDDPNKLLALAQTTTQADTMVVNSHNPCAQINYCDTVKIHGNPVICGSAPSIVFTAFKNSACGATVQWNIDHHAIDSLQILTDSSIKIYFKNINWQGKLYASLPEGACFTSPQDSIAISIIRMQSKISLGPDTVLCGGNSLVVHAGNGFSGYQWQDGSTDSLYNIRIPGTYYVTARDGCGNIFSDTIRVNAAVFAFTIGQDTLRCNNDTIHLNATTGFSNYQWNPAYNISTNAGSTANIYPLVDTFYYASAEKWPGCVVRDTIHISVRSSQDIFLGADTSLCTGQHLTLDAGAGFISYEWNNGSTNRQLAANTIGTYFVKAVAANTCASYDTLKIWNISPLPVFSLGTDTTICDGKIYQYSFTLLNATYLWQDGNQNNQYNIIQAGQYTLAVTQAGCTAKDTVAVAYKKNPVVQFGKDTSICTGNNYLLDAGNINASYTWQDGSNLPQYLVSRTGIYTVVVDLNGCTASDTIAISYIPKPIFSLGKDTILCAGQSIRLNPLVNVTANYLWQDGSHLPTFDVQKPGLFSLVVSNICGSFADSVVIGESLCILSMPNAFTPNGDGLNDLFKVKYLFAVKEFDFSIYNRYGEKIFETKDMQKGWDGTYKSIKQESGSFIWLIRIKDLNGLIQTSSGTVTIIRN
jgi:gliding motility-associated-like protein